MLQPSPPHESPWSPAGSAQPRPRDLAGPWHSEAACRRDEAGLFFAPSQEPTAARLSREQAAKSVCAYHSLERLLLNYERLAGLGIEPVWSINHGPTTSLYYEDPDGTRLEFQTENFPTPEETAAFFSSPEFAQNPIGVTFDPSYLLERLRAGAPLESLTRRDAGVRPGTRPRVNRRAITFRTL